jgi:ketosteroid isomerase-like protein
MKKTLIFAVLAIFGLTVISCGDAASNTASVAPKSASADNAAPAPAKTDHEADIKKVAGDLATALSKNDAAAAEKAYADDYVLVTQTGEIQTKTERIDLIKSGDLKYESVEFSDLKVRSFGDTAVVIGRAKGKANLKGTATDMDLRVSWFAAKGKDGWKFVSAHLSEIAEAPKSDNGKKADAATEDKK